MALETKDEKEKPEVKEEKVTAEQLPAKELDIDAAKLGGVVTNVGENHFSVKVENPDRLEVEIYQEVELVIKKKVVEAITTDEEEEVEHKEEAETKPADKVEAPKPTPLPASAKK